MHVCSLSPYTHIKLQKVAWESWSLFVRVFLGSYLRCGHRTDTAWTVRVGIWRCEPIRSTCCKSITSPCSILCYSRHNKRGVQHSALKTATAQTKTASTPTSKCQSKTKSYRWGTVPMWGTYSSGLFVWPCMLCCVLVPWWHSNDLMTTISGHFSAIYDSCCKNKHLIQSLASLEEEMQHYILYICAVKNPTTVISYSHRDFAK